MTPEIRTGAGARMNAVQILEFRPLRKNSLLGFAKVELPSGMVIADVTILTGERGPWASPPSKPMIDRDGVAMRDQNGKLRLRADNRFCLKTSAHKVFRCRRRGHASNASRGVRRGRWALSIFEFDGDLGDPVYDASEACRLAQNIARNCGYAVFPCRDSDKKPTTLNGFKDASKDLQRIAELWQRHPGKLIGIATGKVSGVSVLDIDIKHLGARDWWHTNKHRIPRTRAYRTRGGGAHFHFQHHVGVRNKQAAFDIKGIDTRGDGGYAIYWFAAGLPCIEHEPPAPWPEWLYQAIWPPPKPRPQYTPSSAPHGGIEGIVRTVREAGEGMRNGILFWAANRLRERGIHEAEAQQTLIAAAAQCGLSTIEAQRTIASAWRQP